MESKKALRLLVVLFFLFVTDVMSAQNEGEEISIATYKSIYSGTLSEERTVAVSLPEGYEASARRYPVLYILDAEYASFASSIGVARYLGQYRIPELIVVGVLNTNRNRDLWSHQIEGLAHTSNDGAENFLRFFSDELVPFIDHNYRTTPHRTIYGRSAGGHFVTYALVTRPALFEAYLASSPVIGFSDNHLLERADEFFRKQGCLPKSYFIYYGKTDYTSVVERIPVLESIIRRNAPDDFNWGVKPVEGRHGPSESLLELLLMLYPDWQAVALPVVIPSEGEFREGSSLTVEISSGEDPVYLTVNGGEPTRSSWRYTAPLEIVESTTLRAKAIRGDLQEGAMVTARYRAVGEYHAAVEVSHPRSGLQYRYVEKQSFETPDFVADQPTKSGVVPWVDVGVREREQFYLLQFDGYIKVPSSGCYRFTFLSNGSKVFLDGMSLVSGHGLMPGETVRELCLEGGYHSLRIVSCILTQPTHVLELYWEGPGVAKGEIPADAFYHE